MDMMSEQALHGDLAAKGLAAIGCVIGLAAIVICAFIWVLHGKANGKPAPAAAGEESPPTRRDLICWVFQRFDSDCDARLNEDEMQVFAKLCCSFDGDSS